MKWLHKIMATALLMGAAFAGGYFYRPIGSVSQVSEVITTAADGIKTITKTTTKQPVTLPNATGPANDPYRPNYTIGVHRGILEQFRLEGGYRVLGNLWIMGAYTSSNDISLGIRLDF